MICYDCGSENADISYKGAVSVIRGFCCYCGKDNVPIYPLRLFFHAGLFKLKRG